MAVTKGDIVRTLKLEVEEVLADGLSVRVSRQDDDGKKRSAVLPIVLLERVNMTLRRQPTHARRGPRYDHR